MCSFRVKMHGGHLVTGVALASIIGPHVRLGGLAVQAGIMQASPVRTGTLRRSWTTSTPQIMGTRVRVIVGTNLIYARRVNKTSKKNKDFVARGIQASRAKALQVIRNGIKADAHKLWVKD